MISLEGHVELHIRFPITELDQYSRSCYPDPRIRIWMSTTPDGWMFIPHWQGICAGNCSSRPVVAEQSISEADA